MSQNNDKPVSQIDTEHHLHPFTDNKRLKDDGGPLVISKAAGNYIWDEDGHRYLDAMAGLWCVNVGYGREELANVAAAQIKQLAYYNTFFQTTTAPTAKLAAKLAEITPDGLNHALFANSGSEANDSAVRLVRHYWNLSGKPKKKIIIGREEGYHGSTLASISMGGIGAMHAQADLPLDGFAHIEAPHRFRNAPRLKPKAYAKLASDALEDKILELGPDRVGAFVMEPIQGAGGVIIPPEGYCRAIQRICQKYDVLLIADEVICGFGRLGTWTGSELFGLRPDLMILAKGISSGYQPISALMVGDRIAETLVEKGGDFAHGFTYSGHPVAAAVALENIAIMEREGLIERTRRETGPFLAKKLKEIAKHPLVGEARSLGLIGAVELVQDKKNNILFDPPGIVGSICRDQVLLEGVVVRAVFDSLVFSPPLTIEKSEIDDLVGAMTKALDTVSRELGMVEQERSMVESTAFGAALEGKTALITGATRGIGASVARRFAREGAKVILVGRDAEMLGRVESDIIADNGTAISIAADLSNKTEISKLVETLRLDIGELDILVGNAAILGEIKAVADYDTLLWDRVMETNLNANYHLIRELDSMLRKSKSGRVILVSSGAANGELANWGAYAASKAGLEAMARAYAGEVRETSIRVNLVDPGEVATEMRAAAFPGEDRSKLTTPDALTDTFVQLASPACDLSGALIPIDAGPPE